MPSLTIVEMHTALTNVARAAKAHPCSLSGATLLSKRSPLGTRTATIACLIDLGSEVHVRGHQGFASHQVTSQPIACHVLAH